MTVFALAFMIGVLNGLRSFTPPAATAWAAHLRWIKLPGPLALMGSLPAVAIFTLLAVFELFADKPRIPDRITTMSLVTRRHGSSPAMRSRGQWTESGHRSRLWHRRQRQRLRRLQRTQAFGKSDGRAGFLCCPRGGPDLHCRRSLGRHAVEKRCPPCSLTGAGNLFAAENAPAIDAGQDGQMSDQGEETK
jgi:hypothetical protein